MSGLSLLCAATKIPRELMSCLFAAVRGTLRPPPSAPSQFVVDVMLTRFASLFDNAASENSDRRECRARVLAGTILARIYLALRTQRRWRDSRDARRDSLACKWGQVCRALWHLPHNRAAENIYIVNASAYARSPQPSYRGHLARQWDSSSIEKRMLTPGMRRRRGEGEGEGGGGRVALTGFSMDQRSARYTQ
jgi:hypothetical protein